MNEDTKHHCTPPEALAALLLRLGLGVMFLFFGLDKFLGKAGVMGTIDSIAGQFRDTYLPMVLVRPFAYVIPFVEVVLGLLLILGLMTRAALLASGLYMVALILGVAVLMKADTTAFNTMYLLVITVTLWFTSKDNRYSLDRVFHIH